MFDKELNEETRETVEDVMDESTSDLDELDLRIKELEKLLKEKDEEIATIKRGAADVVNRNKQLEIDKKYASTDLVRNLLIPISYFEGALKIKPDNEQLNNFLKGFEMVYNLILEQLYNNGLKEIKANLNDDYDPHIHEVFELVDGEEENLIVDVVQKGYYYKDRVLKPTKVKVSRLKETADEDIKEEL